MVRTDTLNDYNVDTEIYEGPLDLLLDLIQKAELDITALSLAKVTDQFLKYIESCENVSADNLSEFLILAAKLVQIKSEALLPRPPTREEGEEDLGESLARQLRVYREIKKTTEWMKSRFDRNLRSYLHMSHPFTANIRVDMGNINIDDLVKAISSIFIEDEQITVLGTVISIPKLTLRKKVQAILDVLVEKNAITFTQILDRDPSRLNIIVVFLALLELIKQDYVVTHQNDLFSEISISATSKVMQSSDFELLLED
jgi:segregation and condensation protein A